MTPTGAFQPVALSSMVKHPYLVKEVPPTRQALKTLARKTLPRKGGHSCLILYLLVRFV